MSHRRFAKPMWHLVDAKDKLVGRIATQIAPILRGKHKPTFSPNYDCGDYIVIINAQHCKLTGNKDKQKTYSWHTGFPGGIKHTNPATLRGDGKAEEILRKAIMGMLAKNKLRTRMARKLRIFPGSEHLHTDQLPAGTQCIFSRPE